MRSSGLRARWRIARARGHRDRIDRRPQPGRLDATATLKNLGLRIAVDDFGTGYSSLAYLSNFSLDIIKLDKSFIDRVAITADGERMVRAVVNLSHTLDTR